MGSARSSRSLRRSTPGAEACDGSAGRWPEPRPRMHDSHVDIACPSSPSGDGGECGGGRLAAKDANGIVTMHFEVPSGRELGESFGDERQPASAETQPCQQSLVEHEDDGQLGMRLQRWIVVAEQLRRRPDHARRAAPHRRRRTGGPFGVRVGQQQRLGRHVVECRLGRPLRDRARRATGARAAKTRSSQLDLPLREPVWTARCRADGPLPPARFAALDPSSRWVKKRSSPSRQSRPCRTDHCEANHIVAWLTSQPSFSSSAKATSMHAIERLAVAGEVERGERPRRRGLRTSPAPSEYRFRSAAQIAEVRDHPRFLVADVGRRESHDGRGPGSMAVTLGSVSHPAKTPTMPARRARADERRGARREHRRVTRQLTIVAAGSDLRWASTAAPPATRARRRGTGTADARRQ